MQRQLHHHALVKITHAWNKDRAAFQPRISHDFGNVFVRQIKGVKLKRGGAASLIGFYHLAPATRVAADGGQVDRVINWQNTRINQRAQQSNRARGIAARIRHALGFRYRLFLAVAELGKSINPARRIGTVGGAGINNARLFAFDAVDQGDRFAGVVVVQAQNHDLGLRHQRFFGGGVFAQFGRNAQQLDFGHQRQTLANLQASRASFAINKYGVFRCAHRGILAFVTGCRECPIATWYIYGLTPPSVSRIVRRRRTRLTLFFTLNDSHYENP